VEDFLFFLPGKKEKKKKDLMKKKRKKKGKKELFNKFRAGRIVRQCRQREEGGGGKNERGKKGGSRDRESLTPIFTIFALNQEQGEEEKRAQPPELSKFPILLQHRKGRGGGGSREKKGGARTLHLLHVCRRGPGGLDLAKTSLHRPKT